jgi:type II secretory pathway pseudopilin PulG
MRRAGISLLELILALAILAGAVAVLGEASRQAMRNAAAARDVARAQALCESKLAEILAGITPAQAVAKTAFDATMTASLDPSEPAWIYTIETEATEESGLISVRVTVTRDMPVEQHPVQFSLVRWMPDPNAKSAGQNGQTGQSNSNGSGASTNSANGTSK